MKSVLFNTHDLVLIFTIYICLLFALFLVTLKKGKKLSRYLLAGFLITQAAIPLDNLINFGEAFKAFALNISPNLFYSFGLAYWIEAPLLLLYIRSLVYKNYKLTIKEALYFIPFILFAIYFTNDWLMLDNEIKMSALQNNNIEQAQILDRVIHLIRECLRFIFGIFCLIELHKYHKQIKNQVADIEDVDLTWLKILVLGFLVIRINAIFVALAIIFSYEMGIIVDHETLGLTSNYVVMFLITGLIFFSAGYSTIFKGIDKKLVNDESDEVVNTFNPEEISQIEEYMRVKKPYLNHLLTLENLANQLVISPRHLSSIINRHFEKNFFEYINYFRIEESKALLVTDKYRKTTMLDIMDMAGFNSKATFNTFFKKLVGVTPTQYRKDFWEKYNNDK
ncbi:helix-turn-helix domain-containing protein [Pseudocolwellia sp. AS88]|uniref:helix-turn-helix domain-containing protein n=1 Tax=Pseudocolwellia TaxID=2848177 RepID=UPI0026ED3D66|nr:helix-turn-helix domain-containing protein [Pseudocolwellia sp. AS88]MDO7085470.1 helix-turn-helix domain-containing protein [Pseudocolwellia sp. AS88]